MFFSTSFIASALLGLAAATTHAGESVAASETLLSATSIASEAVSASGTLAASTSISASATASAMHSASAAPAAAAGMVATHIIQVGGSNGSLVFSPENVVAQVGDLIQFQFHPKNHSVVQSTFDNPCVPIQNIMANKTDAFYSGFMPSNATAVAAGSLLTYTIRVMDAKPIWFYCSQGKHCQAGMVGAINAAATGNKTMSAFKQLAAAAPENLSPGQAAGSVQSPAAVPGVSESAGAGGAGGVATQTAGAGLPASATTTGPAIQTDNAAGRVSHSLVGLGATFFAAFMVL